MADHAREESPRLSAVDRVRLDPSLRTRDDTGLTVVAVGTLAWAIAWIVLTLTGSADERTDSWRLVCVIGFAIGVVLFGFLLLRLRRRRSRQE